MLCLGSRRARVVSLLALSSSHNIQCVVGTSSSAQSLSSSSTSSSSSLEGRPQNFLVPPGKCQFQDEFISVPLLERTQVSPTSCLLRFGLPDKTQPLNLSTCACILAKAKVMKEYNDDHNDDGDSAVVVRPYTPVSTNALVGNFELLVRNYGKQGKLSRHLTEQLDIGDCMEFSHIPFNVKIQAPFSQSHIVMLAGGTGITPMIQALHAIFGSSIDSSSQPKQQRVTLLYGSQTSEDILAKKLLDSWERDYPDRLKVVHVLSREPQESSSNSWTGKRGHIDRALLEEYVNVKQDKEESGSLLFLVCGPPPMYDALCGPREEADKVSGLLAELGYTADQVFKF